MSQTVISRFSRFERYARWTAAGLVVLLLIAVLLQRLITPYAAALAAAAPQPAIILGPGIKASLGGRIVYLFGSDDCHRTSWLSFGSSEGRSDDRLCINLGGETARVWYKIDRAVTQRETLKVDHAGGGVSLRRRDGSPVGVAW